MENSEKLPEFLKATWQNPVMGDSFKVDPRRLERVMKQLEAIAVIAGAELINYIKLGMPELDDRAAKRLAEHEIMPKTLAFCPALTEGTLDDIPRLSALATAVGLMYWGDQTMDRGDRAMAEACARLGRAVNFKPDENNNATEKQIQTRLTSLEHIREKVNQFSEPEDAPFVLACFYDQVLHNEVRMQNLSREYLASGKDPAFLENNAARLAEITTVSAGFPSISSSLYAIYRQHDSLPPLSEIYGSLVMREMLQVCNVVVRLWDELGDWQMDSGHDPTKGLFVINPFNQYDPLFIRRFCELGAIRDRKEMGSLQTAFATFHENSTTRQENGAYILRTLRLHIRKYMEALRQRLPGDLYSRFGLYIDICKRVLEIGYVNRIGDIALMSPELP